MLPRKELLTGAAHPEALGQLLELAETALRTYQPCWSGFLAAPVWEEADARFGPLGELQVTAEGATAKRSGGGCDWNAWTARPPRSTHRPAGNQRQFSF